MHFFNACANANVAGNEKKCINIFRESGVRGMSEPFHSAVSPQGGKDNRHEVVSSYC